MIKNLLILSVIILLFNTAKADKIDSIFVAPDVFVTSKIKPTKDFESERGNIMFEGNDIEKKKNTRLVIC